MRKRTAVPLLMLLLPVAALAQERDTWSWSGTVPRGQAIEIKGVNGDIRASLASGSQVRVTAHKSARNDDVAEVKLEVVEHAGGVTICAVYPAPRARQPNLCQPGEKGRNNVQNNDVKVDFVVEVPRDIRLVARTVNGGVTATALQGDVDAHSVNGGIQVATAGLASAQTVNGRIDVTMGRTDWSDALTFETVNGTIIVGFAGDLNAHVTANTVNGDIDTDFPLTVQGRWGPRKLNGTVGRGGRELAISTVNGSIELRRR